MAEEQLGRPADKLVVIVDDDDSVRELLEFTVGKEGFRTDTAADGPEAMAKIQQLRPHAVILDLMLPHYAGFEVLRRLQDGDTASIPILVISGRYTDRTTQDMVRQESNVVDFMEKPVKPEILNMTLHRILKTNPPAPGRA